MSQPLFNQAQLEASLSDLPLGLLRFYARLSSTNDAAARWAAEGAPDLSLVLAEEQTAGRGRLGRTWYTPPGASLAASLILRPVSQAVSPSIISRHTVLGSLAIASALQYGYNLDAEIKWPNDVLLKRRKVAGVLAEAIWEGELPAVVILGMGVNITPASVPPPEAVLFPAASVEDVIGHPVDRLHFLRQILSSLIELQAQMAQPSFIRLWEDRLAFRGEGVIISDPAQPGFMRQGVVQGLTEEGFLRLQDEGGADFILENGELSLRPVTA